MNAEEVRNFLLTFPQVSEETPFGPEALVYKVGGKMFAILSPDDFPPRLNLKCEPDRAVILREEHESILPGYHMNKKHWNTLVLDDTIGAELERELMSHSFERVIAGMSKKARTELGLDEFS